MELLIERLSDEELVVNVKKYRKLKTNVRLTSICQNNGVQNISQHSGRHLNLAKHVCGNAGIPTF